MFFRISNVWGMFCSDNRETKSAFIPEIKLFDVEPDDHVIGERFLRTHVDDLFVQLRYHQNIITYFLRRRPHTQGHKHFDNISKNKLKKTRLKKKIK